jgi:hypothetical protein
MRMVRQNLTLLYTTVTIITTEFYIQILYILPTQCIYLLCTDLRTVIISIYNIKRLVFTIKTSVFTERYVPYRI